jgi:hypothetical protein
MGSARNISGRRRWSKLANGWLPRQGAGDWTKSIRMSDAPPGEPAHGDSCSSVFDFSRACFKRKIEQKVVLYQRTSSQQTFSTGLRRRSRPSAWGRATFPQFS